MVKLYPIVGAFLSLVSLVLLAVGVATNSWIVLDQIDGRLNPRMINTKLSAAELRVGLPNDLTKITYSVSTVGLWIGCHKEHKGAVTCAYVGFRCFSDVCWIRKTTASTSRTCLEQSIQSIVNCTAYQAVRGLLILALLALVIGLSIQVVSLVSINRSLAMLAGVILFVAGLLTMTAFAVFYSENWAKTSLSSIGHLGYSFKLVIASWPICLFAAVLSCVAASMGLRHKDVSDYSASNY
ncbi:hypothetical protein BWQ96_04829 [Gracilariopsis chorda]|uniref:Uncharacterized protein n=1 Tax=Gracilariopsis chorda TaxID=448386 RepID=A0A2V3ITH6_9FLOR|nr:hypothetical protein BWQ96_04829 [Gracilariopsis chorda]|eukprot:PXF45414.1 hypothetical protein BWQ96_04829 [Gracilariopsis chorda]